MTKDNHHDWKLSIDEEKKHKHNVQNSRHKDEHYQSTSKRYSDEHGDLGDYKKEKEPNHPKKDISETSKKLCFGESQEHGRPIRKGWQFEQDNHKASQAERKHH